MLSTAIPMLKHLDSLGEVRATTRTTTFDLLDLRKKRRKSGKSLRNSKERSK